MKDVSTNIFVPAIIIHLAFVDSHDLDWPITYMFYLPPVTSM